MDKPAWAKRFYSSYLWVQCRKGYAKSVGGLCERCLKKGIYSPGEEVHHKVRLTAENVSDPDIALNWDNLELLCTQCHIEEHYTNRRRWKIDKDGALLIREREEEKV